MNETYSIVIKRDSLKFHAKHGIIHHDGENGLRMEKFHEHTFQFTVMITGPLDENGWVMDFTQVIHCCMELIQELENKTLIPEHNPELKIRESDGTVYMQFRDETISFPAHSTCILPYDNVTTEYLAHWIIRNLVKTLEKKNMLAYPNNRYSFKATLEEEAGCFVEYCFQNN